MVSADAKTAPAEDGSHRWKLYVPPPEGFKPRRNPQSPDNRPYLVTKLHLSYLVTKLYLVTGVSLKLCFIFALWRDVAAIMLVAKCNFGDRGVPKYNLGTRDESALVRKVPSKKARGVRPYPGNHMAMANSMAKSGSLLSSTWRTRRASSPACRQASRERTAHFAPASEVLPT